MCKIRRHLTLEAAHLIENSCEFDSKFCVCSDNSKKQRKVTELYKNMTCNQIEEGFSINMRHSTSFEIENCAINRQLCFSTP